MQIPAGIDWVAVATGALALVTFFLVLETRSARRDATDAAMVVARLTTSRGDDVNDALYLDNLGPAVARQVTLSMRYLDQDGAEAAPGYELQIPAMARGDHYPFVPSIILMKPGDTHGHDRLDDMADQGWSLEIKWSWSDNRRLFGLWWERQRHQDQTVVNLDTYRTAITRGPLFVEPDLFTAVRDLGKAAEKRDRRDEARRSLRQPSADPDVRAFLDEMRFRARLALWRARLTRLLGFGLNQRRRRRRSGHGPEDRTS